MVNQEPERHPLAQAVIDAHDELAPKLAAARTDHVVGLLERFESDIAPLVAPLAAQLAESEHLPQHVRDAFALLANPEHFGESVLLGIALGSILSPVIQTALAPVVQTLANNTWHLNPSMPLSPTEVAQGQLKGVSTPYTTGDEALRSGINAERLATLVEIAGQSIGLEEALLLLRRGQITDADFMAVVRYSNINPRFYAMPEMLKYAPLAVGEVVAANLKGHLDDTTAAEYIGHAGINPTFQQLLKRSAGRPPGIEQMLELRNRSNAGLTQTPVTDADVAAAVRQSDINDVFLPFVMELGHYFPPPRSIVPMLRAGGITEAEARQLLTAYGVGEPWASAFISEAHTTRTTTERSLSATQAIAAYEEHVITRAAAEARIVALRYPAADAALLLDLADAKRADKIHAAAIRRVYARYVGHKIAGSAARVELDALNLPAASVDLLLAQWSPERDANAPILSVTQLQGGLHRGVVAPDQFVTILTDRGYDQFSVKVLASEAFPPTRVPVWVEQLPG